MGQTRTEYRILSNAHLENREGDGKKTLICVLERQGVWMGDVQWGRGGSVLTAIC
jgi:hypothetical protein